MLTSLRREAGVTQVELSSRLGKPQPFISNIERGERRVGLIEFCAIVQALGGDPLEVMAQFVERLPEDLRI